jgi:hypothetical protein
MWAQAVTGLRELWEFPNRLGSIDGKHVKLKYVKKKREELGLKYRQTYWLLGRRSALTTHNKLVPYKQILKPVWTNGIQLWGCTKSSNIVIIQRFKTKYSGTLLMRPGTSGTLTSIETLKCKGHGRNSTVRNEA